MEAQCQAVNNILQTLDVKKNKDLVFILDYSSSMESERKLHAIKAILEVFDKYL